MVDIVPIDVEEQKNSPSEWYFNNQQHADMLQSLQTTTNKEKEKQYKKVKKLTTTLHEKTDTINKNNLLEYHKTPGLNINELHKKGITGKNVHIAIIDQTPLLDHEEYAQNIVEYTEGYTYHKKPQMHGVGASSIAVGKKTWVAPEAKLHYFSWRYSKTLKEKILWTRPTSMNNFAEMIEKIREKNKTLQPEEKIRAISISYGIVKGMPGYNKCMKAIKKAEEEWIYVAYIDDSDDFAWISKAPDTDPNSILSYIEPIDKEIEEKKKELKNIDKKSIERIKHRILIPKNAKTLASEKGKDEYTFDPTWWSSWTMPYIVGLYALCCQIQPKINKKIFLDALRKTAYKKNIENIVSVNIVNPVKLIEYLQTNPIIS